MVEGFLNITNQFKAQGSNKKGYPGSFIFTARVNNVILNEDDNGWADNGEYASIGYINFSDPTINNATATNLAKPLFPNQKYYPVLNEMVYIVGIPSLGVNENPTLVEFYYFQAVNVWNSNHHNALPDEIFTQQQPESQQQDYPTVGLGAVRRVSDEGTEINLGKTFFERANIKTLQPYEGDYILEGRWGNSIRFGSTVADATPKNTWSDSGINGDPIVIIRNGQYENNQDPWVPIVEDINQDSGSVYLTSTQKINLTPASSTYNSYSTKPKAINEYIEPQVIINSNRLVFNTNKDHLLLSSIKSVGLNAVESVNIDTPKTIIQSNEVYLGGKDATEPVLKGDETIDILVNLVDELTALYSVLSTLTGAIDPVAKAVGLYATNSSTTLQTLTRIKTDLLTKTKSNISKTL